MTVYSFVFIYFSCISAAGVALAILRSAKLRLPGWLGTAHGMVGLAGVGIFFVLNLLQSESDGLDGRVWWSLVAFTVGLFGGLIFFRVLFRRKFSVLAAIAHGAVAVLGLALLFPVAFPAS
ncbi:hypothetical protein NCG89_08000 [Spongiibacter taiwanensis]|uniref:hypothetical protein n=1 Tax=Spongiibacter taiwanensis TaxID=1748242 RepID=UPI00203576AD|nr:hypothetical protein [Spongiibacter taiwanensis]USA44696.1 hypothetical protein NCG89_08000 [Spongiibacter taiwanensis]